MKKICIYLNFILITICSLFFVETKSKNICKSLAETSTYAKVLSNCTLYKSPNLEDDIDNVYFVIPETFFVTILETINDECVKVQYGNFVGFINSNLIIIATFSPKIKTLENITFDIKDTSGTQVWSKPSASSSVLTTIPASTKKIKYIAMAYGTIPSGGQSNIWYYVNFTPEHNSTNVYEGYVYSENVTNLSKIVPNSEKNPEPEKPDGSTLALSVSSPIKVVIISIIAIPVIILFLIVIYRFSKSIKEGSNKHKELKSLPQMANSNNYQMDKWQHSHLYHQDIPNQNQFYQGGLNQTPLHQELQDMSKKQFVRKVDLMHKQRQDYPKFPSYDSDDDLLWFCFKLSRYSLK